MPPQKVLFLDIDGVIVTGNSGLAQRERREAEGLMGGFIIDRPDLICVHCLNQILRRSGAKIVISSSWRIGETLDSMRAILNKWHVDGKVIGLTPSKLSGARGWEIKSWMNKQTLPPSKFVILDDSFWNDFDDNLTAHLVQTTWQDGLQQKHVALALDILGEVD
jgi:hypothetical protein